MIRTFLFDLGNVLLHFSHRRMCEQIGAILGKTADEVQAALFGSDLLHELECGRASEEDFQQQLEQSLNVTVEREALRLAASDIFTLNAPMPDLLRQLKSQGFRLVLVSNTSLPHIEWVRKRFDVLDRFDELVLSYEIGAVKPDPAFFSQALAAANCKPAECFYTDDISEYVEAARQLGIIAEVFTDASSLVEKLQNQGINIGLIDEAE